MHISVCTISVCIRKYMFVCVCMHAYFHVAGALAGALAGDVALAGGCTWDCG